MCYLRQQKQELFKTEWSYIACVKLKEMVAGGAKLGLGSSWILGRLEFGEGGELSRDVMP